MVPRIVDMNTLRVHFPTHRHSAAFWESLGRTVATYGFLEELPRLRMRLAVQCRV